MSVVLARAASSASTHPVAPPWCALVQLAHWCIGCMGALGALGALVHWCRGALVHGYTLHATQSAVVPSRKRSSMLACDMRRRWLLWLLWCYWRRGAAGGWARGAWRERLALTSMSLTMLRASRRTAPSLPFSHAAYSWRPRELDLPVDSIVPAASELGDGGTAQTLVS